jgi:hypothetical protein
VYGPSRMGELVEGETFVEWEFEREKSGRIYAVASSGGQETDKRVGLFGRSAVGNSRNHERVYRSSERRTWAASAFAFRTTPMPLKYISRDVRQQSTSIVIFRSSDPSLSLSLSVGSLRDHQKR